MGHLLPRLSVLLLVILLGACDIGSDPNASPLEDLELTGVDFELNSMVISNNGEEQVRTEDLWAYRDGESFKFDIFIVDPRAEILFSMRELGEISTGGGEIALFTSEAFEDADSMLQYLAWGDDLFALADVATEAGLWPPGETVEVPGDTVALLKVDIADHGPTAWEASDGES